jgi:hypothetical protein
MKCNGKRALSSDCAELYAQKSHLFFLMAEELSLFGDYSPPVSDLCALSAPSAVKNSPQRTRRDAEKKNRT